MANRRSHVSLPTILRRGRTAALILLTVVIVVVLTRNMWLPSLYTFLDVSQPPRAADIIVVLGGSGGPRERYAAELYLQDYADTVLVNAQIDDLSNVLPFLLDNGVPENALTVRLDATTTYDEAQNVLSELQQMDAHSALIVTDAFHTRRARATYQRVFESSDVELTFVAPDESFDVTIWWTTSGNRAIWEEYPKMLYYLLAYGVWPG